MVPKELLQMDLNLLVSMQVLLEERSVSRAAARLFITQPAMSKTLSRLRELFRDPLFTRSSHGMQPTPRALMIGESLAGVLWDIEQMVAGPDASPAQFQDEINFALSEYIGVWLLPRLMGRVYGAAPGLTLRTITRVENQLQQLANGDLDLAIHIKFSHYGEDFLCQPLVSSRPVLLAREGHPLGATPEPSWEDLAQYPVVRLYIPDAQHLEVFQARPPIVQRMDQHLQRGWFETSHLLTALEVLRQTDYLMPVPPFLLHSPAVADRIQPLPMPADVDYDIEYVMVRHRRTENSAVHTWLWDTIMAVLEGLRDEYPDVAAMHNSERIQP